MTTVPASRAPYHDAALDCFRVPLPHGQSALIDAADAELRGQHRWHVEQRQRYLQRVRVRSGVGRITLARLIVGAKAGEQVVYLNDDQLDCRRTNLLLVPHGGAARHNRKAALIEGMKPTSQFKGVTYYRPLQKWSAYIRVGTTVHFLGRFPTEIEAAQAYDAAAAHCMGPLVRLNLPARKATTPSGPRRKLSESPGR